VLHGLTALPSGAARQSLAVAAVVAVLAAIAAPPPAGASVGLERIGVFAQPVDVTAPPGDRSRVFVAERSGRIRVVRRGRLLSRPFADLRGRVEIRDRRNIARDQGGLLSLAFAPRFRRTGRAYVLYTGTDDRLHVDELRRGRLRTLLTVPRRSNNDLGGQLRFGPDGMLWVSLGYGGDPGASRDLGRLQGKLLRIDPRPTAGRPYRIPPDNPFVLRPDVRPEIYAYGLRNPWRFAFDRPTGGLVVADVGESSQEEVSFLPWRRASGADFGWPSFEGNVRREPGASRGVRPVLVRPHRDGVCAIIGGHVVRGGALPGLRGRYVYGDLCTGELRSTVLGAGGARGDRSERARVPYLSSFGRDGRGRTYATSLYGPVFRLVRR
jgi:glucose/arabinose dehydrogenase